MSRIAPHQRTIEEMETWEILQDAIPRGEADEIARIMRRRGVECSGWMVRSWMNDPDADEENPNATAHGRRNPLDEVIEFMSAVGARSGDVEIIRKKINHEAARIQSHKGHLEAIRRARERAKEFLAETEHFGDG